jgi:ATP-binding cassette subfamily B protein
MFLGFLGGEKQKKMKLLLSYLRRYKNLVFIALLLATVNQTFSLLDPFIYGKIIDRFVSHPKDFTESEFI